jgi:hypothetical protein
MWVEKKIVPKHELLESIPLHVQKLCEENVYELKDHVEEETLNFHLPTKKLFLQVFPITC